MMWGSAAVKWGRLPWRLRSQVSDFDNFKRQLRTAPIPPGPSNFNVIVGRPLCLEDPQHHQRHVVVLFSASGELVGGSEDPIQDLLRVEPAALPHGFNQSLLAPFFLVVVHCLTDTVGESHEEISRSERRTTLLVGEAFEQS